MPDSFRIYKDIISYQKSRPLALFDLDSTLFNVTFRTQKIISSFMNEPSFKNKFSQEILLLKKVELTHLDWGLEEPARRVGLDTTSHFFKLLKRYWNKHFFSSQYLYMDKPYDGAVQYVQALAAAGVQIKYLTGRDAPNMREGTLTSLEKWGLPLTNPDLELLMKPGKGLVEDEDFKSLKIEELKLSTEAIWFFENEPVIIHSVASRHPDIKIIWVDTTHSGKAEPPKDLPVIRTSWRSR